MKEDEHEQQVSVGRISVNTHYFINRLVILSIFINSGKAESDGIAKFLLEINERWKNVSVELRCIQSLLEEVIAYWKKFLDLTGQFEAWLDRSFPMVKLPEEEKMNYFQVVLLLITVNKFSENIDMYSYLIVFEL